MLWEPRFSRRRESRRGDFQIAGRTSLIGFIHSARLEIRRLWRGRAPLQETERRQVIERLFPRGQSRRQFFTRFAALMMLATTIAVFLGPWPTRRQW